MDNTSRNKEGTYLSFRIENEIFAINAENVIEVVRNEGVAPVPKTAEYIVGILNFRGDIISVISTQKKLNIPQHHDTPKKVIIVIEFEVNKNVSKVGLIADKVIGVLNIQENKIQPVLEFGNYYNPEYLKGAMKVKDSIITFLNVEKIFSADEVHVINDTKEKTNSKK